MPYLNLPILENLTEMEEATRSCLEAIRFKPNQKFHHRLSKLNPGEHLFWKHISSCQWATHSSAKSSILSVGKKKLSTSRQTANALNRHFFPTPSRNKPHSATRCLIGKAPGTDKISSEPPHHLSNNGRKFVLNCINQSWQTGIIPAQCPNATVIPPLKPGKATENPGAYRPISLTSILCKVAEKMVLQRLLWVWKPHPHQYAYRLMHTTAMQRAHLVDTVEQIEVNVLTFALINSIPMKRKYITDDIAKC
ncbi:hypothetical protein LSM04_003258 [Trypanosoma melophagium]|uniref:uncharacterized protein n=1 Tax=Trypanosoma melophagium TaxID=715481 RepID=UPI00351A2F98|nr:hypothetical protein LSM04_003258 [Trypanosoma melophagium]